MSFRPALRLIDGGQADRHPARPEAIALARQLARRQFSVMMGSWKDESLPRK